MNMLIIAKMLEANCGGKIIVVNISNASYKSEIAQYFVKFHKVLGIKLSIHLWLECCLHFIEFIPHNILEPWVRLKQQRL